MQNVCCGCFTTIPIDEQGSIYDENLWISVPEYTGNARETNQNSKQLKLSDSIELITGLKIVGQNKQLVNLCHKCVQNVQSYINLRARLLFSCCSLNNTFNSIDVLPSSTKSTDVSQNKNPGYSLENMNTINDKTSEKEIATIDRPLNPVEIGTPLHEIINNNSSTDNTTGMENEQDNNNLNDLETCNTDLSYSTSREIDLKVQDNDIESEIDVCSGEDEEILELDDQSRTVNVIEIDTSSESDIEVCDYQPIGKRFKNFHAFSPHLLF